MQDGDFGDEALDNAIQAIIAVLVDDYDLERRCGFLFAKAFKQAFQSVRGAKRRDNQRDEWSWNSSFSYHVGHSH